nr:MAG TPA: hypothetical protein [Bacteriophage sp.]
MITSMCKRTQSSGNGIHYCTSAYPGPFHGGN